jgi:predicted MFS family arabinose efflux permease
LWESWLAGARYVAGYPPIRSGLLLVAALSWTIGPYSTLMPVFARDIYAGGPGALGMLLASAGIGALAGTLFLASRPTIRGLDIVVVRTGILAALALLGFAGSRMFVLALPLLALMGFGFIVSCASLNTLIQTMVDDDKRGRVMSLYTMAFIGISPLGNLAAGAVAGAWGAPTALAVNALACLAAVGWFFRRLPRLREQVRPADARAGLVRKAMED